ncbi:hypothetical protein Rsub_03004 [Raphidocelis subcapitata]|uniref:RING-CH-type domain-containing protein n=1 Tax=Raphidocelis subcapitata TaxID=307507 RepID=A0A2V0NYQ0_9CHLO|nr:hypothetical protein Rsub_03004 [Raphidocelis subcapitata]|eukprot:GBF90703.1 hypothetical protein Rsub_03004 [Raphidocelis subcapitata]
MPPCAASQDGTASDGGPCCWICLDEGGGPLTTPCACPRPVHACCLARWQLQQAGRAEETACRFCCGRYPDWRAALPGICAAAAAAAARARLGCLGGGEPDPEAGAGGYAAASPVMAISAGGSVHHFEMLPGPFGRALFRAQVGALLGYGPDEDFEVVFECRLPLTGEKVLLPGFGAFEAARACAAASAARRLERRPPRCPAPAPAAEPAPPPVGGARSTAPTLPEPRPTLARRIRLSFEEVLPWCGPACPACPAAAPPSAAPLAAARAASDASIQDSTFRGAPPRAATTSPAAPVACPPPPAGGAWRRLMCMAAA